MSFFGKGNSVGSKEISSYERKKLREAARQRKQSHAAREIAPSCPEVVNPKRRDKALKSLKLFCETYGSSKFALTWSKDQLAYMRDIEHVARNGGQLASAMPRGTGKTTIILFAVIWCIVTGNHPFFVLIGATAGHAEELLADILTELETNELLYEDFPALLHPVRQLEGINQRRLLWNGKLIRQRFTKKKLILPNLPETPGAGTVIQAAGLLGRLRGMAHTRHDGKRVRPSLVLIDDPQTDKSAKSPRQNETREKTLAGAVLGLGGPGKKIAAFMTVTVIEPGDMADRILDRQRHPEWQGKRTKLLDAFPSDEVMPLWHEYYEIRSDGLRRGDNGRAANTFYRKNRKRMDRGSRPSWPARFNHDELSATQNAMNWYFADRHAFFAEGQNDPSAAKETGDQTLDVDQILRRTIGHKRGVAPVDAQWITAGIDVQKRCLYWSVLAVGAGMTAQLIDYGTFPEQRRLYFTKSDITSTIQNRFKGKEPDAQLYAALEALAAQLFGSEYRRDDGSPMRITKAIFDARFEKSVVMKFARQSPHAANILPAFGMRTGFNANRNRARPGQRFGLDYTIEPAGSNPTRYALIDSSAWITRVVNALKAPIGSAGTLTLFEPDRDDRHQLIAEHFTAEYPTEYIEKRTGRALIQWRPKPDNPDNDWLDSTKMAYVGAYELGARPSYDDQPKPGTRKKREPRFAAL